MVAAGVRVDEWPTAELTDPGDDRFVEHSTGFEVGQQGRQRAVGRRHQFVFQAIEVVAVRVPEVLAIIVPVDADERDAAFDQPPGEQHALSMNVATILVAGLGRLARQVEGFAGRTAGEQVERLTLQRPQRRHLGDGIQPSPGRVETAEQRLSISQPRGRDTVNQPEFGNAPIGAAEVPCHEKRIVSRPQPATVLARCLPAGSGRVKDLPGENHTGGQAGDRLAAQFAKLGDHRPHVGRVLGAGGIVVAHQIGGEVTGDRGMGAGEVGRIVMPHRPNHGELVGMPGQPLKQFGELQSRHIRGDRLERSPHFRRGVGLHIERVDMTRSAPHEQQDTGLGPPKTGGTRRGKSATGRQIGKP